ncbi:MAG: hypothetical protein ABIH92_04675 [Nanoarchaeota archaeon]
MQRTQGSRLLQYIGIGARAPVNFVGDVAKAALVVVLSGVNPLEAYTGVRDGRREGLSLRKILSEADDSVDPDDYRPTRN